MSDNFVWTKHVEERSVQRGITSNEVWATLRHPDSSAKSYDGSYKFFKFLNGKNVCIVAKHQQGQWVILTTYHKENPRYSSNYSARYNSSLPTRLVLGLIRKLASLFK